MPLIQGGPPEWIWERTPNLLKWEVVQSRGPDDRPAFELRVQCGLEIMRLQFFTEDEIRELEAVIGPLAGGSPPERPWPDTGPASGPGAPRDERPPGREEGVVSDPDFGLKR